jgi:hypothetical protein
VAAERLVDDADLRQPLHRGDGVPMRDDEAQREAVVHRERLAVHGVGQQQLRLAGCLQRQAALETYRRCVAGGGAAVGSPEQHLGR